MMICHAPPPPPKRVKFTPQILEMQIDADAEIF